MKYNYLLLISFLFSCAQSKPDQPIYSTHIHMVIDVPNKKNVWVFVMAGQSNMAGRGEVQTQDTIENSRIFTIDKTGSLIYAKEPLHFYEPAQSGLDCGMSFAIALLEKIPDSVSILMIPTAIGGSSIDQWINDSTHREVKLMSNFIEKVALGQKYGTVKAVLWHQGESDATDLKVQRYASNLSQLLTRFRNISKNERLPIILGEIGKFNKDPMLAAAINKIIAKYSSNNLFTPIVRTDDLKDRGDRLHFNSESQREMGTRYAAEYLKAADLNINVN